MGASNKYCVLLFMGVYCFCIFGGQESDHQNNFYFTLSPCGECNYCHVMKDNLFPLFVAMVRMNKHNSWQENKLYCDKMPFKSEVFKLLSDKKLIISQYQADTMQNIFFELPHNQAEYTEYFKMFMNQLYQRFGVARASSGTHKRTITLVQRYSRCRNIVNIVQLEKVLKDYCARKNFDLNIVQLEKTSIEYQLSIMRDADVLIACHGAALVNAPFIRSGGKVIEIFPFGFKYALFYDFTHSCRPDIAYQEWHLPAAACYPRMSKPRDAKIMYRYWRDQDISVDPLELIARIEK